MGKHEEFTFTTSGGRTLRLRPVSPLLIQEVQDAIEAELRAAGAVLDAPTYTVTDVTGAKVEYSHVIDVAKKVDTVHVGTPEEQAANEAAWLAYQDGTRRMGQLRGERLMRVLFGEGVDLSDDAEYQAGGWARRVAYYGGRVPDSEPERSVFYLQTVCLTSSEDLSELMSRLTLLSTTGTVEEAKVERAMALFRDRAGRGTAGAVGNAAGAVDAHGAPGGDADGAGVGQGA